MPLNVCVDYDGTYTTMPDTWIAVIDRLRLDGANVFCISSRFPNAPITDFPGEVHYACGQDKWEFAHERGIQVDIWIDDWPACIGEHPERRGQEPPQKAQRRLLIGSIMKHMDFAPDGNVTFGIKQQGG